MWFGRCEVEQRFRWRKEYQTLFSVMTRTMPLVSDALNAPRVGSIDGELYIHYSHKVSVHLSAAYAF